MFYIMYLTGLCQRRHWPEPSYECFRNHHGYSCTVRVNNREYTTDGEYENVELARNAAATRAYMICRNFSVNDGMYPGQKGQAKDGVIQGLPVAIGTGRRNTYSSSPEYDSGSGNSSPRSSDAGLDGSSRRASRSSTGACFCGRGYIRAYERCDSCLREGVWR